MIFAFILFCFSDYICMYEYNTFIPVSYAIFNCLLFFWSYFAVFLLILEDKGNL